MENVHGGGGGGRPPAAQLALAHTQTRPHSRPCAQLARPVFSPPHTDAYPHSHPRACSPALRILRPSSARTCTLSFTGLAGAASSSFCTVGKWFQYSSALVSMRAGQWINTTPPGSGLPAHPYPLPSSADPGPAQGEGRKGGVTPGFHVVAVAVAHTFSFSASSETTGASAGFSGATSCSGVTSSFTSSSTTALATGFSSPKQMLRGGEGVWAVSHRI